MDVRGGAGVDPRGMRGRVPLCRAVIGVKT